MMRRCFRRLLPFLLLAVVVATVPPPAHAACPGSAPIVSAPDTYVRIDGWPGGNDECHTYGCYVPPLRNAFAGVFWALGQGNPAAGQGSDNGGAPILSWLDLNDYGGYYFYYPGAYLAGDWANDGVDGCLSDAGATPVLDGDECTALLFSAGDSSPEPTGYFAVATAQVGGAGSTTFHESITLVEIPKMFITSSTNGNAQDWVAVDIELPQLPPDAFHLDSNCDGDIVVGYKVYQFSRWPTDPPADISRDKRVWGKAVGGERPGGLPIPLDQSATITMCSSVADTRFYLATTLVTESGFETPFLSQNSTRIDCEGYCGHQVDQDTDAVTDQCDNCLSTPNPGQTDFDVDFQGDACDLDDGLLWMTFADSESLEWQGESFESWNLYRGDLDVLRAGGDYIQAPGSNPAAAQECGRPSPDFDDGYVPDPGKGVFYLATGVSGGTEGDLGQDSAGTARPNASPCS